ncbi:UNVERIFIED_CONTAM: hypothetical protein NCL1_09588 [Trichonephila clavipes]
MISTILHLLDLYLKIQFHLKNSLYCILNYILENFSVSDSKMSTGIRKTDITTKYRIFFCSSLVFFLASSACILYLLGFKLHVNITNELILNDVALIFFILSIIVLTLIIRVVFVFGMEYHFSFEKNNSFLQQLQEHMTREILLLCLLGVVGLCMFVFVNLWFETLSFTPQRVFEIYTDFSDVTFVPPIQQLFYK